MVNQDIISDIVARLAEEIRQRNLTEIQVLTEFVVHNAELEQLEEKLRQFNIFEAVGMESQETKHSAFLAFLLDPQQPHGLGNDFLKLLLQRALIGTSTAPLPINIVRLHLMSLVETLVERERSVVSGRIDILLINRRHEFAVIIENKLLTSEHDDQLTRYYEIVQKNHRDRSVLGLYLTVDGERPSDSRYLPISYSAIAEIIESLVVSRTSVLGPDVRTLLSHYAQMLRRNVVNDPEIEALCREIYRKHKRAIDMIVARIPDRRQQILEFCKSYLESSTDLRFLYARKDEVVFIPAEWDVPALKYAPPNPYGVFQFHIRYLQDRGLMLRLSIRPGRQETRQKLYDMAKVHPEVFAIGNRKLKPEYCLVFSRQLIPLSDLLNADIPMV